MTPREVASALWVHARPKLWPFLWLLTLFGFGWAHWDRGLLMRGGSAYLGVLAAWTLLNVGTLWLNAALDRDEGEVLMGAHAPVPPGLAAWGYAALVASVGAAALAHPLAGVCAALSAALSVAYSHPRIVWKGHPIGGPVVNVVGYGLLSPLAGWACVDVAMNLRTAVVLGLGAVAILGMYFIAQAFQEAEDAARGYRTLVATHGPRVVITAARLCFGVLLFGALGVAGLGWVPRVNLLVLPFVVWIDAYLARWAREARGGDEGWARSFAFRLLAAAMAVLALNFGEYVRADAAGEPVAGLGTAAGRPSDRPALPPSAMRAWEAAHPDR